MPRHVDGLRAGAVVAVGRSSSNSSSNISAVSPRRAEVLSARAAVAARGAGQLIGAATPIPPLLVKVMAMVCPVPLHIEEAAAAHVVHTRT